MANWKDLRRQQGYVFSEDKEEEKKSWFQSKPKNDPPVWKQLREQQGYYFKTEPTDYWKEQPVRALGKNINAGFNMLPRSMVGIADATVGGLGIKPVNKVLDSYKDYYKKADEELAMLNQGHEYAGGVAQGVGQAIPTTILALMNPAAAVGNALTTAKGTQLVANAASLANPTTLNAARTVLRNLKSNPTLYSSMLTSVGNQYLQGVNEGATREQAIKSAVIGGVPSALIEVSGGIENITNILANKTKGVAGAMLQSALEEGFEEIVQYPIENIGQKVAYDKNMPLFSMKETAVINPKEMAFSGLVGGTVGGLMGGGAAGVNTVLNKRYSKMVDAEYTKTIDSLPEDSPILERVNQMQSDNVNIDDNMKIWVINSARNDGSSFESEVDKLLNKNGQANASIQNENIAPEQMVEQRQNVVKTQNNGSAEVNPTLSIFKIKNMRNAKEVKQNVYEFYKNTIISDSNNSKPIINKSSGMNIEVSRATINQTFQADEKYSKNQDNEIKINAMANVVDLIQNGEFTVVDNLDTPSSKKTYANITGTVNVNGVPYDITMDVRKTDNGKKLFVHSLSTNQQQVVNKKSGVIYNGVDDKVRQQYPKVYDILDRIGQVTGTKFKFVETIYDPSGQEAGFANGQYDAASDSIEIALDTFNPFMVVAKHEITHMLEKENPKLYNEYKGYVLEAMKQNGTYENEYGRMAALYESRGLKIDKLAIEDELVADATELFLTDENAINNLVANNKTLGQKVLDVLRKLINKIEDILKVSGFTEGWLNTEQLREAERLWVNALNSVAETEKKSNSKMDKKQSLKDNPYNEKSYHPFKETDKWEEQFERRTKWLREKVDGIKTGKFKGSFGMYATVTPSIKDGKYQITVFDKNDTPMMDAQRNTIDEIAEFLQEDGFVFPEQINKFSLKAPIEETKDLIAIHNINEDKLKGVLELGGFPVPSIAVIKAEDGHDNFGDISVVFTKDTIDPQSDRRNKVFGSDVYSKRFPYVNFKLNDKVVNRVRSKVNELTNEEYRKTYRISLDDTNIENVLQGYRSNGDFVKGYMDEPLLKLAFLKENGIAFKPIMKEKTYGQWDLKLLEIIKKHLGDEEASITFRGVKEIEKIEPDIRRIVNEFQRNKVKDEALLEFVTYKEPMGFGEMDSLMQQVSRYTREGAKKEIDYYKTKDKLEKVTPKKSYRDWLSKLSEGIIEKKGVRNDKDPFTPSGNRRSFEQLNNEYALDSIVRMMKGDVRGEEGFMYGLGNVRAGMTKEFKSIKDIKQDKNKLVTSEEFREIKDKSNEEYYKLSNLFSKYHRRVSGSTDAFDNSMFETAKKGRIVPSAFKAELREDGYEVKDIPESTINQALDFLNSLKDMPTEYFEAKPQRSVGFEEVAAIVAPKRTDKGLLQQLKEKAIKVVRYDEKIEGDRLKKVNSIKNVKFSLKDSQGRTMTQEQAEYFKDSAVRDNEGNLLVMYHGTPKGGFTKINPGTYFTQNKEYADNYQSPNASSISTKKGAENPETYEVYLNIKKPFDTRKAKERKIFNEEYYNKYGMGTPLMESGLPDWLDGMDLQEFIEEHGYDYDGLILDEGGTGGYGDDVKLRGYSYVVFDSNQVKNVDNLEPTFNEDIRYSLRTKEPPKKTIKAYKLLRIDKKTGKLYPLFVGATEETPTGVWLDADEGEMTLDKKTGTQKVKSKLGNLAYRPGWHLGDVPLATHIGIKGDSGKIEYMNPDHVWAEVDVAADINYQGEANKNGINPKTGKMNRVKADIKRIPVDGFYRYKTNPTMTGEWIITGAIKINRVLSDSEAAAIVRKAGYEPLQRAGSDTRYQLRDNAPAKDVEKLQKTVTRLKEQFKLTKGVKLDEKAVRRLSKSILKEYGSTYSQTEFETKLYSVYMGMVNGDMEYEDAQSIITEVAREVVENASVLNDAMYKEYSDLRNTMRNTAISIEDMYKGDFDAVGGWNDFRKRNFGRMNITKDGMSVDSLYQELSDTYPELFVKDIANPADQLMLISDVLDDFVPIYENPYNRDLNKSVEYLALEIFDGMTSIPEAKATFADKKKAEKQKAVEGEREKSKARIEAIKNKNVEDVEWLKYQNKEKLTEILNKEKTKRDNAVAEVKKKYQGEAYKTWWRNKLKENDIKSHYQEMIKDLRANRDEKLENQKTKYKERISGIYEDRKIKQAKDRIRTMTKNLSKMLRNPTQKKHIPKALDKTIAELLAMLDFTTDRQNENTQLKLRDLRAEFEKLAKVSDEDGLSTTADPYIAEALEMLHDKRIVDMSLQEIEILRDIVGYFENMVKTYNKAFLGEKWVDISSRSTAIIQDLNTDNPMTESAYGRIVHFKNMMNWGMLNPQSFFERMGVNFNSLYDDFRKALDVKIMNTKIAQDYMKNLLKGSTIKSWTGKKAEIKSIRLEGGDTIELTQAQLMSFYLLMKREQARGHIFGLGVKAAPIVAVNKKGIKYVKNQFEPVKITLNDATKMIAALTKEQRRIADGIGKFMNTYSKQWVNEATLRNYGYELAKEENYFPIKSDKDFLKSDFDNTNLDPTFTSMGFLKSTVKGAGNAIILEDVFDVFTEHADKSATYNAFVGITESMKKIVNYKTENSSIKQSMNKKFGIQAFNFLKKFMVDLQGGLRTEGGSPIVNALIRINKRTVLGLNVRTIVQQPTAIIRAAALIDPKYLIKGVAIKGDKAEMLQYAPIALWKSWGYFNLDTGRTMKDIILDTTPVLDKQYAGIQIADDITWTKIWNAVKLEIADTEPGLKGKEFFDAVNYRFSEIIDKTQVVDTVMHRSDAMRQSDSSWKYLTAFMSEPTKSYNLLLNAVEKYNSNKTPKNKKELTRTISAWTATMLVNTLVVSLIDVLRRKEDDDETFKDKWLGNVLNDVTGYVPLVRDIYSLFEGYSVKRMEYNGIERIVRAINRSKKYTEEMVEGKKHSYPARLITKDWIESLAYVFGIGAINVSKDLEALLRNYTRWIDDEGAVKEIYEFMFKK